MNQLIDDIEKPNPAVEDLPPALPGEPSARNQRPKGLPDKFWDADKGEVRTGALWRSYQAVEQRFSPLRQRSVSCAVMQPSGAVLETQARWPRGCAAMCVESAASLV